jgi:hypothetical protein
MDITLTIRITYDDAARPDRTAAIAQLDYAARHLANNGLLSGENDCLIVDEWTSHVG